MRPYFLKTLTACLAVLAVYVQPVAAFGAAPCAPSIKEGAVYNGVRDLSPKEEAVLNIFLRKLTKGEHCIDSLNVDLSGSTKQAIRIQVNYLSHTSRITKNLCRAKYHIAEASLVKGEIKKYSEAMYQLTPEEISSGNLAPSHYYWITKDTCSLSQATERGIASYRILRKGSDASDVEYILRNSTPFKYSSSNEVSPAGCFDSKMAYRSSYNLFMLTRDPEHFILVFQRTRSINGSVQPAYCIIRVKPSNLRNETPDT